LIFLGPIIGTEILLKSLDIGSILIIVESLIDIKFSKDLAWLRRIRVLLSKGIGILILLVIAFSFNS